MSWDIRQLVYVLYVTKGYKTIVEYEWSLLRTCYGGLHSKKRVIRWQLGNPCRMLAN